ncbi:MAG TPA: 3-hydroxyacyl-CoA dehydrogenase NAD-binding domain-containing protein, partial [Candidatus Limnocylindria bacterium]
MGVLGAGTMGAGIAQVAAEAGLAVLIHDPVAGAVERAQERIAGFIGRRVEKGQLTPAEGGAALGRLATATELENLASADLVIEAAPEDLELKRGAFRRLDAAAADRLVILASNTSSLSITRIAEATRRPQRVVGMHFFNPVPVMALVEVIAAPLTDPAVSSATADLARRMGKTPVMAADTPGFIVNRVARPFYLEALRIVGEGLAGIDEVDAAMRGVGFRMGPFELIDAIGADVNLAVTESVAAAFAGEARYRPHPLQRALVEAGRLGRKTGAGFYDYAADGSPGAPWAGLRTRRAVPGARVTADQIATQIVATVVNEAASAVEAGVATPDAIDTAMRLGTNYPL